MIGVLGSTEIRNQERLICFDADSKMDTTG